MSSNQLSARQYRRPWRTVTWWTERPTWMQFMVRELSAVFVGGYALLLLVMVSKANDASALEECVASLRSPLWVVLHLITLAMVIYHTFTWFQLTPQAMPVWRGEERVNPKLIIAANYVAWVAVSVLVAWLALRGS
jgi:fumarate reductase subunit C